MQFSVDMYRLHLDDELPVLGIEEDSADAGPMRDGSEQDMTSDDDSADQRILRTCMQALVRVNRMRKGIVDMRKTSALLSDDFAALEQSALALQSGVQALAADIQQFNNDLEVEYYLDDMIKRLVLYGEQIKYVPLRYTRREFPAAGTKALKATTSLQQTSSPEALSHLPAVRFSQSDTTGLATKSTIIY